MLHLFKTALFCMLLCVGRFSATCCEWNASDMTCSYTVLSSYHVPTYLYGNNWSVMCRVERWTLNCPSATAYNLYSFIRNTVGSQYATLCDHLRPSSVHQSCTVTTNLEYSGISTNITGGILCNLMENS